MKQRVVEHIEYHDGVNLHSGVRVVDGTNKLTQRVVMGDRCLHDSADYEPQHRDKSMLTMAKWVLSDIVKGEDLSICHPNEYNLDVESELRRKYC